LPGLLGLDSIISDEFEKFVPFAALELHADMLNKF